MCYGPRFVPLRGTPVLLWQPSPRFVALADPRSGEKGSSTGLLCSLSFHRCKERFGLWRPAGLQRHRELGAAKYLPDTSPRFGPWHFGLIPIIGGAICATHLVKRSAWALFLDLGVSRDRRVEPRVCINFPMNPNNAFTLSENPSVRRHMTMLVKKTQIHIRIFILNTSEYRPIRCHRAKSAEKKPCFILGEIERALAPYRIPPWKSLILAAC